jgi:hypothetical protein
MTGFPQMLRSELSSRRDFSAARMTRFPQMHRSELSCSFVEIPTNLRLEMLTVFDSKS